MEGRYCTDLGANGQNNLAWVREIVAVAIIEAIARQRFQRGDYHKQVAAQERAEHQPGDLVDIRYDFPSTGIPGWRGPSQIASVNVGKCNVTVRVQGRTFDRRRQEVRMRVPYLVCMLILIDSQQKEWSIIRKEVENLTSAFVTVGTVFQFGDWHLTPRSSHADGRKFLDVAFAIVANVFRFQHVVAVRACRGIASMPVVREQSGKYKDEEVLTWFRGNDVDEVIHFTFEVGDLDKFIPVKQLACEPGGVDKASVPWTEVCFVQFLNVCAADGFRAIKAASQIPLLGGAGVRRRGSIVSPLGRHVEQCEDLTHQCAPHSALSAKRLDVQIWFPIDRVREPFAMTPSFVQTRPSEGVFTRATPNKNVSHFMELEFANKRPRDMKFGAPGTNRFDSIAAEAGFSRTDEASDDEDVDWPGRKRRKDLRAGVQGCFRKILTKVYSPPSKNLALVGGGACSAPGVGLNSVEISPGKLLSPDYCSPEEGVFVDWQHEFAQDADTGADWRREFAEALPDEGKELEDVCFNYLTIPQGKLPRDMAKEEFVVNWQDVEQVEVKEVKGPFDLGCSQRCPRAKSHNVIDARCVIIWKMIEGNVGVKCRLSVRGFKDKFQDFDSYAGAISRSGQRFANAVAAEHEDFMFFSLDVSQAFAKGFTFEGLSKLIGTDCRAVLFDVPKFDFEC